VIVVTGAIGSGKSTWARAIARRLGCNVVDEPFDTNGFLASVSDVESVRLDRSAFLSQLYFLMETTSRVLQATASGVFVQDSSVHDVHNVWSSYLLQQDVLSVGDFQRLEAAYADCLAFTPPIANVIYLKPSVEVMLERIRVRARPYEQHYEADDIAAMVELRDRFWSESGVVCTEIDNSETSDIDHALDLVGY